MKQIYKEVGKMFLAMFAFWALYWEFWIAFEKPHYDEQERLFRVQLEQVDQLKK